MQSITLPRWIERPIQDCISWLSSSNIGELDASHSADLLHSPDLHSLDSVSMTTAFIRMAERRTMYIAIKRC